MFKFKAHKFYNHEAYCGRTLNACEMKCNEEVGHYTKPLKGGA